MLRYASGAESDTTFLGPAGAPTPAASERFDGEIRRWLAEGRLREPARLVADPAVPDGAAVDVCAWAAAR